MPEGNLVNPSDVKTILYVEDNAVNVYLVQAIFDEHAGIHLLTATSGKMGLEFAQKQRPDLILLDLNLPDMDGEEFLALANRIDLHPTTTVYPFAAVDQALADLAHDEDGDVGAQGRGGADHGEGPDRALVR